MKTLFTLCLTFLIGLAAMAQAPIICDEDGTPRTGFEIPTLRPVFKCPFDTGFVYVWPMDAEGGGGDAEYIHSMAPFTDSIYHLGGISRIVGQDTIVGDSHLLEPGRGYCAICVRGTDYNAVGAAWGVADSAGGITPMADCSMVPDWEYVPGHPWSRFVYDEPTAEALGERWTIWRSNNADFSAPYEYKTPRSNHPGLWGADGYPLYSNSYNYIKVLFTFSNGTQCNTTLDMSGLRIAPPVITDMSGRPLAEPIPPGYYIQDGQLRRRD